MRFRVLGRLEAHDGDRVHHLGAPMQRSCSPISSSGQMFHDGTASRNPGWGSEVRITGLSISSSQGWFAPSSKPRRIALEDMYPVAETQYS